MSSDPELTLLAFGADPDGGTDPGIFFFFSISFFSLCEIFQRILMILQETIDGS